MQRNVEAVQPCLIYNGQPGAVVVFNYSATAIYISEGYAELARYAQAVAPVAGVLVPPIAAGVPGQFTFPTYSGKIYARAVLPVTVEVIA